MKWHPGNALSQHFVLGLELLDLLLEVVGRRTSEQEQQRLEEASHHDRILGMAMNWEIGNLFVHRCELLWAGIRDASSHGRRSQNWDGPVWQAALPDQPRRWRGC